MPANSPAALAAAFQDAVNAGDVDAAVQLWVEDGAIVQPSGQAVCGRDAIAAALRALVEHRVLIHIHVQQLFATADVAVALGTLTMTGANGHGATFRQQSRSTVVYARGADGHWRIAIDAPWGLPQD